MPSDIYIYIYAIYSTAMSYHGEMYRCPIHIKQMICSNGPLARYVKLRVVHAPGMPVTFSPSSPVSDPDIHHGTCVTHLP